MRKFVVVIILSVIYAGVYGQITIPTGTNAEIKKFLSTTTCVVLKNEFMSEYNDVLKDAIKTHWDITPVEYVSESEFNKLRKDASKSFLVINQVYFEKDKTQTLFDFLILTIGGSYKTVDDMPTLCGIPLCYRGGEETDYNYKMGIIVKFIQNHVKLCNSNPNLNKDNIADYYTKISGKPENKIFYVLKDEVEPELRNHVNFSNNYQYKFEFSTKEKIAELIKTNDKNAIILHEISPQAQSSLSYCVKIIIDTENALIYYYDMQKVTKNNPPYLLASDLKKLSSKK